MNQPDPKFLSPGKGVAVIQKMFFLITTLLILPLSDALGQKEKDVEIILECVEYAGNDKFIANFGYFNPNRKEISVPDSSSSLIYNDGESNSKALNRFQSGRQTNVFQGEFTSKGKVLWHLVLPNGNVKEVTASINSNHCGNGNNILPYYPPPQTGKTESVLGPELKSLYDSFMSTHTATTNFIFQISNSRVLIEIKVKAGSYDYLLGELTGKYGFTAEFEDRDNNIITGWLNIENLVFLANYAAYLEYCRPVFPSVLKNTGRALNLGDYSMRSDFVRNGYDVSGDGVKIGILSDSYDTRSAAAIDVQNGDLPGTGNIDGNLQEVQIIKEYPHSFTPMSDEGRAMLQIIHDIAPKADLAFRTGYICAGDMAAGINELADNSCNIIVDDISYITEPFFRDGIISQAVDNASSRGITYFSAAGNFGKKSYSAIFTPAKGQSPGGLNGTFHDFGGNDMYQSISLVEGHYIIVLQWIDDVNARNDFDIYLANTDGNILLGFNRNNNGTEPIEILPFTVQGGSASTN
ncbi:MAG: hypothetical protein NTW82_10095, partial [Bacteroidia bacterium]|nr:hypothetical protein [Bacteroidia bacterium]